MGAAHPCLFFRVTQERTGLQRKPISAPYPSFFVSRFGIDLTAARPPSPAARLPGDFWLPPINTSRQHYHQEQPSPSAALDLTRVLDPAFSISRQHPPPDSLAVSPPPPAQQQPHRWRSRSAAAPSRSQEAGPSRQPHSHRHRPHPALTPADLTAGHSRPPKNRCRGQ